MQYPRRCPIASLLAGLSPDGMAASLAALVLFRELAEVLQRLERTSSNNALIDTLAAFLSKLNPEEARAVAYLLRGEVAAPFAGQEIGMADPCWLVFPLGQNRIEANSLRGCCHEKGAVGAARAPPNCTLFDLSQSSLRAKCFSPINSYGEPL